jgi:SET domain-containing protein
MAIMSGYSGERAKGDFVKRNKQRLIKALRIRKKKLPSYQTIARILENVGFEELTKVFKEWAQEKIKIEEKEWISLDGKGINGTLKNTHKAEQEFINLVTVFSNKQKVGLSVGKVGNKSNEIPLVKELIKELDLKGVIFTLDALHCQKETTKSIIESKNDYVIGVKKNQPKLLSTIKKI